jgi:hypothetical protein
MTLRETRPARQQAARPHISKRRGRCIGSHPGRYFRRCPPNSSCGHTGVPHGCEATCQVPAGRTWQGAYTRFAGPYRTTKIGKQGAVSIDRETGFFELAAPFPNFVIRYGSMPDMRGKGCAALPPAAIAHWSSIRARPAAGPAGYSPKKMPSEREGAAL